MSHVLTFSFKAATAITHDLNLSPYFDKIVTLDRNYFIASKRWYFVYGEQKLANKSMNTSAFVYKLIISLSLLSAALSMCVAVDHFTFLLDDNEHPKQRRHAMHVLIFDFRNSAAFLSASIYSLRGISRTTNTVRIHYEPEVIHQFYWRSFARLTIKEALCNN